MRTKKSLASQQLSLFDLLVAGDCQVPEVSSATCTGAVTIHVEAALQPEAEFAPTQFEHLRVSRCSASQLSSGSTQSWRVSGESASSPAAPPTPADSLISLLLRYTQSF